MSNIIEVKNLVKNYKDVHAVNDISFTVEEGSFFAFLGINGAGKSTTINILCTVLEKTSGNVKIGRYDLDKEKNKIKELIGIVFQGSVLDKQLTVKENLESRASYYGLNKKEIAKRIESLTQTFDLSEILKRKYGTLSGGQRRRVDIARALINRPKLLFLDEPTTGLDPVATEELYELLKRLNREKKTTILMVSHDLNKAVSDAGLILHVNKRSGCGYFGPADKYLDSDAARHFLGLDYKDNKNNSETVQNGNNNNKEKKPLDKVKKGERYV